MADHDDPFQPPPDATVMRPRPGAGRRGSPDPGARAPVAHVPTPAAAVFAQAVPTFEGLNPLVRVASPLLMLAGRLRSTLAAQDVTGMRRYALDELRRFEEGARGAGVSQEVARAARYILCAAVDESVLSTPWGAQSDWQQQTLLIVLHREAWGGEKFFDMLDRLMQDPERHIDLLELQYLCIALGFMGKYQVLERGHARLAEVQQKLYRVIRSVRGAAPDDLSLQWKGREDRRHRLVRYVPWWVVGAGAAAILSVTFVVFYAWLGSVAAPVHEALARIGREGFTGAPPPAVRSGPTLKQLLAEDEARGSLSVDEEGGRTRVTLASATFFASGSATPNPAYADVLTRIGQAINQVPGRVLVEGHTDDQPLRSLTYRNNFELSRERAVEVARILQAAVQNPARIEWSGAGSAEPRYRPESTPENRARNRRVEIIHVPEV